MSEQLQPIGFARFTDGATRPVFEDADGRQCVEDDGERVFGIWLPPADGAADVPLVVEGLSRC
jgi:hypothetical protein